MDRDFAFGRYLIQSSARRLLVDGAPVRLGARAFDLLLALVEKRGAVVSKNELLDLVWPGLVVEENNLQVHVSTLRKLLGPQIIVTLPGRGYRFNAAQSDSPAAIDVTARLPSAAAAALSNLPALWSPLFGRDAELTALAALLLPNQPCRLITVTGAGGMGKTRLAQAAALAALQDTSHYPDGVWLIELAAVTDSSLVPASLARVLGITLPAHASHHDLATFLANRRMLIVLDNCEHVIAEAAALAGTLTRTVPTLKLLVTSQEPLKVDDEYVFRLGTLSVPVDEPVDSTGADGELSATLNFGALGLFDMRAREALPQFKLNADNLNSVIDICRRLDGIPLAIELAAARLPLLGVEGLRARLDDRFRLLTNNTRMAPKRQQTLHAALEWSHSLLSADEQKVLRRLGIFVGSFSLDAAQHVAMGDELDLWTVLDHLVALVDKSLVISESGEASAAPRYRLLTSARAFALERLRAADEATNIACRHADAMLAQSNAAYAALWTADSVEHLEAALPDVDNLRAALSWAAGDAGDLVRLSALVGASAWLWRAADLTAEGRQWFDLAVSRITDALPPAIEARLLLGYATLAHQAAADKELPALQRAVTLYRTISDRRGLYEALVALAQKQVWAGDLGGAEQRIIEADAVFDASWPLTLREGQLTARTYLFEMTGRPADGQPLMEELVAIMRASGDARKLDFALMQLAENLFIQGKVIEAISVRREIVQRVGNQRVSYAGTNLGNLCAALVFNNELDDALQTARASMAPLQRVGMLRTFADHFALLACKLGRYAAAARLLGRANAGVAASGFAREASEQRAARMTMEALRSALAGDELDRLLIEGAAMTDEAAVRMALEMDRRMAERAV